VYGFSWKKITKWWGLDGPAKEAPRLELLLTDFLPILYFLRYRDAARLAIRAVKAEQWPPGRALGTIIQGLSAQKEHQLLCELWDCVISGEYFHVVFTQTSSPPLQIPVLDSYTPPHLLLTFSRISAFTSSWCRCGRGLPFIPARVPYIPRGVLGAPSLRAH